MLKYQDDDIREQLEETINDQARLQMNICEVMKSSSGGVLRIAMIIAIFMCFSGLRIFAGNLAIDGGKTEVWKDESRSYGVLTIGTENGSGSLVASDSTINLTDSSVSLYVGWEKSPGYEGLSASLRRLLWSFSSWLLLSFIGKPFQAHPSADQCFVKAYPASMLNVCLNVAQVMLIPLLAAPLRGWEYACTPA